MIKRLLNVLFFIGVLLGLVHYITRLNIQLFFFILIGLLLFLYYLIIKKNMFIESLIFLYLFILIFIFKMFFYQEITNIKELFLLFSHFGYAYYILENNDKVNIFSVFYYVLFITLCLFFILTGDLGQLSQFSSANMVNFIFLAFSSLIIILRFEEHKVIDLYPAVANLLVSIFSLGRAGILISLFLLSALFILKFMQRMNRLSISLLMFASPLIIIGFNNFLYDDLLNVFTKFGTRNTFLMNSPRERIWSEYLYKLNIGRFFFGYDNNVYLFNGFTNVHNSFLDLHFTFGLGAILIFIILVVIMFYIFIKHEWVYFVVLFSLLLRAMTDIVMLVWMYDYILIYIILQVIRNDVSMKSCTRIDRI